MTSQSTFFNRRVNPIAPVEASLKVNQLFLLLSVRHEWSHKVSENRDHQHTDIKVPAKFSEILTIGFWVIMLTSDLQTQQMRTRNDAKSIYPQSILA